MKSPSTSDTPDNLRTPRREVEEYAIKVFGDPTLAKAWLQTPNIALAGALPLDLLTDDQGTRTVMAVLNAIEYGGVV